MKAILNEYLELVIVVFFILCVGCFVFWNCSLPPLVTERGLVAFSGNTQTRGSFFLLSGSIDEVPVYRYLYKVNTGGIKQSYKYIRKCTIFETDESPRLEIIRDNGGWGKVRYNFYIPYGSIKTNFELDISK